MAIEPPNEFELARKRAAQQEASNLQGAKDAIARRAASLGGGVSGAMIRREQIAGDQSAKRLQSANEGINTAERAENRRVSEVKEGRQFQTSEREAGQGFAATQADLQRRYGTSEREAGQGFARGEREAGQAFGAGQADIQRQFQTSERIGGQDFASIQADLQRKFQTGERLSAQDYANIQRIEGQKFQTGERMGAQQFASRESQLGRDLQTSQFNKQFDFQKNQAAQQRYQFDIGQQNFAKTFGQAQQEFEWSKYIDEKNIALGNRIQSSNEKDGGILGSIFGSGTFKGGKVGTALNPSRWG